MQHGVAWSLVLSVCTAVRGAGARCQRDSLETPYGYARCGFGFDFLCGFRYGICAQMEGTPPSVQGVERGTQPMAGRSRPRDDKGSETGKVASPRTNEEPQLAVNHSLQRADNPDQSKAQATNPSEKTRLASGTQVAGGALKGRPKRGKAKELTTPVTKKGSEPQLAPGQGGECSPRSPRSGRRMDTYVSMDTDAILLFSVYAQFCGMCNTLVSMYCSIHVLQYPQVCAIHAILSRIA